jgi:hypothetical protein
MKPASRSRLVFALLLTVILIFSIALLPMAGLMPASDDQPSHGLQLSIVRDTAEPFAGRPPRFRVELRNTGKDDLTLNLGIMLANGRCQYARAISLMVTDSEGKSRVFDLREPATVGGRIDAFILPLASGAMYSMPIDLGNYWPASSKEFEYKLRGSYSIKAQFKGERAPRDMDILLASYWIGSVTSNTLNFQVPN